MPLRPFWVTALAVCAAATLLTAGVTSGNPAAPGTATDRMSVQAQIDAQLAAYPGGKQISATEIAYDDGRFVITFARPQHAIAGADCPSGWFCFYDGVDFEYPRGKLSDCGWVDLTTWGWQNRTESVHYNKPSGSVTFIDHGGEPSHTTDVGVFSADTGVQTSSDVQPFRNTADHTYSFC